MKRFFRLSLCLILLFALLLSACGQPTVETSSTVDETSSEAVSIEETSSEEVSEETSSKDTSYTEEASSEEASSVEELSGVGCSGEAEPIIIPEDEPYVELTALSEDEIADLNLPEGYYSAEFKDGFFTKELIAVSFEDEIFRGSGYLHVAISRDGGATWKEQVVGDSTVYESFITFSSEKNGYLAADIEYAVASQSNSCIYVTHDGGETWERATSINTVCTLSLSDVLFISRNVGFVSTRSLALGVPIFCRTTDGGMSWEKITLQTEELENNKASYGHICKAEYKNGIVEFTVEFRDNNAKKESDQTYYSKYVSTDMGQTFEKAE